jgi:hypothetical protein
MSKGILSKTVIVEIKGPPINVIVDVIGPPTNEIIVGKFPINETIEDYRKKTSKMDWLINQLHQIVVILYIDSCHL